MFIPANNTIAIAILTESSTLAAEMTRLTSLTFAQVMEAKEGLKFAQAVEPNRLPQRGDGV